MCIYHKQYNIYRYAVYVSVQYTILQMIYDILGDYTYGIILRISFCNLFFSLYNIF